MLDDSLNMNSPIIMIAKNVFLFLKKKIFNLILWLCPYGLFLLFTHKKKNRNLLLRKIDESIYSFYEKNNSLYTICQKNKYIFESLNREELFERKRKEPVITKDEVDRLKDNIKQGFYDDELEKILKNKQV